MHDGRFRFETFIIGPSNRLALSAAREVAESPARAYNPLFLYAEAGLGKTHLLGALGWHASQLHPGLVIQYRAAEDFAVQLRVALERGEHDAWRREWSSARLVLVDDVQFLVGQDDAQLELRRMIAAAPRRGVQFVLTSDRPPGDLDGIDPELVSSMSAGLVTDIAPPELETRTGILRRWCVSREVVIDEQALAEIARPDVGSVRELLAAVRRLHPRARVSGVAKAVAAKSRASGAAMAIASPVHVEPPDAGHEFDNFLSEIAAVVTSSVEQWRARLAATVARWAGEGYATHALEQFLDGVEPPDVDAIESQFSSAVNQLRDLEREAARLDPRLAGVTVFRDPSRLEEAKSIVMRAMAAYEPPPAPAPHLVLGSFQAGARNQLALRAAGEVIAIPGARYNPLYIHGPASSGKTHLSHAIANALVERDGGASTVAVVDGAALGDELIEAIRGGEIDRWRMRYRSADAIIVDNVQRIGGSDRLQDEFFHLFNAFIEAGKQVVLTADVAPPRLTAMAARLQSRFEAGLVVEIGKVSEAEAVARHTPVPDGAEAAAPTIDNWFEDVIDTDPARPVFMDPASGVDSFFLDPEKVITEWPALDGRMLEDPR
jgi:chromosomal replication initiation ATPase DnaA